MSLKDPDIAEHVKSSGKYIWSTKIFLLNIFYKCNLIYFFNFILIKKEKIISVIKIKISKRIFSFISIAKSCRILYMHESISLKSTDILSLLLTV